MPIDDPNDLKRIDNEIRLNELKAQAEELTGGEFADIDGPDLPPDLAEEFLRNVVEFEKAGETTHFKLLEARGIDLPPPAQLTEPQLRAKLKEIIQALAEMNTYL